MVCLEIGRSCTDSHSSFIYKIHSSGKPTNLDDAVEDNVMVS